MEYLKMVREARKALETALNPRGGLVGAIAGPGPEKDALIGKALGLLVAVENEMDEAAYPFIYGDGEAESDAE